MPMRRKIVITGDAALVGETASRVLQRGLGDVVVLGEADAIFAEDLMSATGDVSVRVDDSWETAAGADVVVIAGGDVEAAARHTAQRCPGAVAVVSADPVEEACATVLAVGRFPRGRVLGVGPEVEALRLRAGLAAALQLAMTDVTALVVGGRGERALPIVQGLRAGGMAVTDKLAAERVASLVAALRNGAPAGVRTVAAATAALVAAVVGDTRAVVSCTLLCQGELGVENALTGVPVAVGATGAVQVLDAMLDPDERAALVAAAVPYYG